MRQTNIQRLLWKEYREGWPVIAAFLVLPLLVFPVSAALLQSDNARFVDAVVMFAVPFTAVLWASEKRRTVKQGRDVLAAVLPVTPMQDWAASFLIPALTVGICGGWMQLLYMRMPIRHMQGGSAIDGVVIAATAFMVSSFLSKSVSHLLGIITGTIWIVCTLPPFVGPLALPLEYPVMPVALAVAALGLSEFRKTGPQRLKALGVMTLALLILVVFHQGIVSALHDLEGGLRTEPETVRYEGFGMEDGTSVIRAESRITGNPKTSTDYISYEDDFSRNSVKPLVRSFPSTAVPVAIDVHRRVYVLSQQPGHSEISVIRWDVHLNRVEQICKFAGRSGIDRYPATWDQQGIGSGETPPGWADSEGTRLLLRLRSAMGTGMDLVLIHLSTGAHRLIIANGSFAWDKATWTKDRVYLTGYGPPLEVDTTNYSVKPLIAERTRGK